MPLATRQQSDARAVVATPPRSSPALSARTRARARKLSDRIAESIALLGPPQSKLGDEKLDVLDYEIVCSRLDCVCGNRLAAPQPTSWIEWVSLDPDNPDL